MNLKINGLDDSLAEVIQGKLLDDASPDVDGGKSEFESVNTRCQLFKGDNLVVLNELSSSYCSAVDLCYIDPPYNTCNKFIYNDSRRSKKDSIFGSHSDWMTFMEERLILLRKILKPDGIVAVSIDDYEQPYLRLVMDKVFGEENFISSIVTCRSNNGKGAKHGIATNHEYIIVYGMSKCSKLLGFPEVRDESYNKMDEHGYYKINGLFRKKGDASRKEDRPNMYYPLYYDTLGNVYTENLTGEFRRTYPIDSSGVERRWLWGKDKAKEESWKLYASQNGVIYVKNYHNDDKRIKPRSLWIDNRYLTERATNEIKSIYGEKVFETPKPVGLIEDLILSHSHKDALVIDFFAGTGTTAHAAHNLNIKDGGQREVILVEQCQSIDDSHIASKRGFSVIADITEYRLQWLAESDGRFEYHVEPCSLK